jgi:hypothetical protein
MGLFPSLYTFWHSYGSDIQNGAVVLSAVAAFAVINSARANGRKRSTLDLILHQESDRELIDARLKFNDIKAGSVRIATYGSPRKKNSTKAQTIRKVLNLHELTAVAIQEGVIDERVYRRWFNSTYVADYEATKGYISAARITYSNAHAFLEFERAAIRWRDDQTWNSPPGWWVRKWRAFSRIWTA